MPIELRQLSIVAAVVVIAACVALRNNARYQAWTRRHTGGAVLVMGALVGTFVSCVWAGVFGFISPIAWVAAASASAFATHRRLTR